MSEKPQEESISAVHSQISRTHQSIATCLTTDRDHLKEICRISDKNDEHTPGCQHRQPIKTSMTSESLLQDPNHCFKVRNSCLLCWNTVLQTAETKIKFINFEWSKPWAFSSPELTLTEYRLTVIGKGSVQGQTQHTTSKRRWRELGRKSQLSVRMKKTKRQGALFLHYVHCGYFYCDKWSTAPKFVQSIKKNAMSLKKAHTLEEMIERVIVIIIHAKWCMYFSMCCFVGGVWMDMNIISNLYH